MNIMEYLRAPNHCLYCQSENITDVGDMEWDDDNFSGKQLVKCEDCDRAWWDVLTITSVIIDGTLDDPEPKTIFCQHGMNPEFCDICSGNEPY